LQGLHSHSSEYFKEFVIQFRIVGGNQFLERGFIFGLQELVNEF
jgi:hypothetical protein